MVQTEPGNGGKRCFRLFQILLFAAVLGLVWYGFGRYVLAPAQSSAVPQYVGSLKLVSHVEGPEALAEINKLHGTSISLQSAFIADYSGTYQGSHVKVWVGEAESQAGAADLISRMVMGIARGGSGFANPRQMKVAGRDVWQADGKGGQFYFYISPEAAGRVVWLTIEGNDSAAFLESAVKVF